MKKIFVLLLAGCLLRCSQNNMAGTTDETMSGNKPTAMVYNPDGTPAIGAMVKVFQYGSTSLALKTETDTNGRYSVAGLNGTYSILSKKDTFVAFQESASIFPDTNYIKNDTLEKQSDFSAHVGLQPGDNYQSVTVQVLGTDIFANVDTNGKFLLSGLGEGNYRLRLSTTLPNYTTTYYSESVTRNTSVVLNDTLWLIYTGIPVVTGMAVSYDTVQGTVRLHWNNMRYREFLEYIIYKDFYDSVNLSPTPIAARTDTIFFDTIFKKQLVSGRYSFNDTADYRYKYRVAIRNNSGVPGQTYKLISVIAVSPTRVRTFFDFSTIQMAKGLQTDSASVIDTILIIARLNNKTSKLGDLQWTDLSTGATIRRINLDTNSQTAIDTIKYAWKSTGVYGIECLSTDLAGRKWRDTVTVTIVTDAPDVQVTTPKDTVSSLATIRLHITGTDTYGTITRWELDPGGTGKFTDISGRDTFVLAPGRGGGIYPVVVRVTNDDGNFGFDTVKVFVPMFVCANYNPHFQGVTGGSSVVFDNKMWIIGGGGSGGSSEVWNTIDGKNWNLAIHEAAFAPRGSHSCVAFDNKMWVIGGQSVPGLENNDVWYSSDGITWNKAAVGNFSWPKKATVFNNKMWMIGGNKEIWNSSDGINWVLVTPTAAFPVRSGYSIVVFDNKMWIIGGNDIWTYYNDVWYSSDGISWLQATSAAPFSPRSFHTSVVFDGKMWVIGGQKMWIVPDSSMDKYYNDVWYSSNGSTWMQATPSAAFTARCGHMSEVFDNRVWVIGGWNSSVEVGDMWYSY